MASASGPRAKTHTECVIANLIAEDSYLGTLQINDQAAKNIATLIEQDIARNIELYDLSLHGVIDGINDPDVMRQDCTEGQGYFFSKPKPAREVLKLLSKQRVIAKAVA